MASCRLCRDPRPSSKGLCHRCLAGRVVEMDEARQYLARVLRIVAGAGFVLRYPVRVEMVDRFDQPDEQHIAGLARYEMDSRTGLPVSASIQVRNGYSPFYFCQVLAHEVGHTWIAQYRRLLRDDQLTEGFAQLVAVAWLRRLGGPAAEGEIREMMNNPDPVYGGGLRLVSESVGHHGLTAVVASLVDAGQLPAGRSRAGRPTPPSHEPDGRPARHRTVIHRRPRSATDWLE